MSTSLCMSLVEQYFYKKLCNVLLEFRQNTSVAFVDNQEIGIKNPNRKKVSCVINFCTNSNMLRNVFIFN